MPLDPYIQTFLEQTGLLVQAGSVPSPAEDIPVRLYIPEGTCPFPVLVYFHGGGVAGNLNTHDTWCRYPRRIAL